MNPVLFHSENYGRMTYPLSLLSLVQYSYDLRRMKKSACSSHGLAVEPSP
jgi:hypothetical protein